LAVGVLVCWPLVCWCAGVLVCWCAGRWCAGRWCAGVLAVGVLAVGVLAVGVLAVGVLYIVSSKQTINKNYQTTKNNKNIFYDFACKL
jgi:predicted phage tail protein